MELFPIRLASRALRDAVDLLTIDMRLARTEVGEIIARVEKGATLLIAAAVVVIPAIMILLFAGPATLVEKANLSWTVATLIVGGAVALVCIVVAAIGYSRLRAKALIPDKTMRQLRRDARMAADIAGSRDDYGEDRRAA